MPFFILLILLSSCMSPQVDFYDFPTPAVEEATEEALTKAPFSAGYWPCVEWWRMFDDPALDAFVEQSLANSPTLKIAFANIALADYDTKRAGSRFFPLETLEADTTDYRYSKTGFFGAAAAASPPGAIPLNFRQTTINLSVDYQIDIWGRNRDNFRAALSEMQGSIADAEYSKLLLSLSVARSYFRWQIDAAREAVAQKQLAIREQYLELVQTRMRNNLDNAITESQKAQDLLRAEENALHLEQDKIVEEHQLKRLIAGQYDEQLETISLKPFDHFQFPLPCSLPFDLLAHRPDVISKLWQAEMQAYLIRVAKKDFFPNFDFLAMLGFQTIHLHKLFNPQSFNGSWGPALHMPIFDGGYLMANLGSAEANYYVAVQEYNDTVLKAVQEVLDSLTSVQKLYQRVNSSKETERQAERQYRLRICAQKRI